ncbi:uncharacterized protein LOC107272784 [Cephus cinctus]|uniref:Uncharacterized protein LOC107272784 n=1 Tax=Cephus cinctus TaxID=211228 RepID=A0AAJ7FS86_CEPCN|nr:uncharacterized protein LOC107272784 [Cephus cinctus]
MHFESRSVKMRLLVAPLLTLGMLCLTECAGWRSEGPYKISYGTIDRYGRTWSTPQECARSCQDDESPRNCYYQFTIEYYTTMNSACQLCQPNATNQLVSPPLCQCVQADGYERTILSINRMLPGPSIQVCLYDNVVIDVNNKMDGTEVSLHWHGLFQNGYQYYDGVPYVTQCPITHRTTFRYRFVAKNSGTHFYHSHIATQKIDGQYGSLVVRDTPSNDPHYHLYDEDLPTHVIVISDYMHELSLERYPGLMTRDIGQSADNFLINGKGKWFDRNAKNITSTPYAVFDVQRGKRYRFRVINSFCTVCISQFSIEKHPMLFIAQDGESVSPRTVNVFTSASGERFDFVLTANQTVGTYWIKLKGLGECADNEVLQLAILRYNGGPKTPTSPRPSYNDAVSMGVEYNNMKFVCDGTKSNTLCPNEVQSATEVDPAFLVPDPDYRFVLPFWFHDYSNELDVLFKPDTYGNFMVANDQTKLLALVNNISHQTLPYPPLSQGANPQDTCNAFRMPPNCTTPCRCTHVLDVKLGAVVEVMVYDARSLALVHPFHLHGYSFRVFKMGRKPEGTNFTRSDVHAVLREHYNTLWNGGYTAPPGKDTIIIPQGGYVIFRFLTDNPGWWLFHCHFVIHTMVGMELIFHVGDQYDLPPVPNNFPRCGNYLPEPFERRKFYTNYMMRFTYHLITMKLPVALLVISTLVRVSGKRVSQRAFEDLQNHDISYGKSNDTYIVFSTPQECNRKCIANAAPLTCYYHFTLEFYPTMNRACDTCKPNNTNPLVHPPQCQCIEADGYERTVLSINRMLPGPSIQICQYDRVVVDVQNNIPGLEVTIHWHGTFQKGTQYYDGVPFVTQCPIHSGNTFRYQFTAINYGTLFYHSHSALQKLDGQYGSFIVRQPASVDPHSHLYDEDLPTHVLLLSDFLHEMSEERFPGRTTRSPGQIPDSLLINGKGRWTDPNTNQTTTSQREIYHVKQGKKYRFRTISAYSTSCIVELTVQNHSLLLIAQDGDPVVEKYVNTITLGSGERADFILHANQTIDSYWIQTRAVGPCLNLVPSQSAIIQYEGASDTPSTNEPTNSIGLPRGIVYNDLSFRCDRIHNDTICVNQFAGRLKLDSALLQVKPDYRFVLPVGFHSYAGQNDVLYQPGTYRRYIIPGGGVGVVSIINNISNVFPPSPPLSQGISESCNGDNLPRNCTTPCECTHVLQVKRHSVVEVMLYDISGFGLYHPFHLHGYDFYVFDMGNFTSNDTEGNVKSILANHENKLRHRRYKNPPGKDTVLLPSGGYVILRFKADNPGWWLFHCHIVFHMIVGMELIFHVGNDYVDLPPVPPFFPRCYNFKPKPFSDLDPFFI